ncbi:hypothetical protein E2C01_054840 [Portunus trituberculatus]|uniref:Uncharacterized protein n=1 Tax=Portunus trituberculatus TaxID=210409 RepID=A0A5B7GW30_PORTR|nr:hypothetical protein [Portunus trituberculatus]
MPIHSQFCLNRILVDGFNLLAEGFIRRPSVCLNGPPGVPIHTQFCLNSPVFFKWPDRSPERVWGPYQRMCSNLTCPRQAVSVFAHFPMHDAHHGTALLLSPRVAKCADPHFASSLPHRQDSLVLRSFLPAVLLLLWVLV